jgi:hypothetical protein
MPDVTKLGMLVVLGAWAILFLCMLLNGGERFPSRLKYREDDTDE